MREFFNMPIHVVVYSTGRCKQCNTPNEVVIHDYGKKIYRDLEKEMDETKHYIRPITCRKCGSSFSPEFFVYKDHLRNAVISKTRLLHGNEIGGEEAEKIREGHRKRFDVFAAHEEEFWKAYTEFALNNWTVVVNELSKEEIEDAYAALGITERLATAQQYRRDVLKRFTTQKQKETFWRAANRYFVIEHLLELGAESWQVEKDKKTFGPNRTRFAILNFPLHDGLEEIRTRHIGEIVKLDKGDNPFLFRRISQLTDKLKRAERKISEYHHQIEKLKIDIAEVQRKLNEAYEELRRERENKITYQRDPDDISKIHELKSLVRELIEAIKEKDSIIQSLQPQQEQTEQAVELEESTETEVTDYSSLQGKTIGIIGGWRRKDARKYPCEILTHEGEKLDPEFFALLTRSDILVILTRFVSHAAMWEAKAHAITEGKPILYEQATNLDRILTACIKLSKSEVAGDG